MGMGAQQPGQQPQVPSQGGKAGGGQAPTTPGQVPPQGGKAQQPGQPGLSTYADPYRGQQPGQVPPQLTGYYPPVQPGQPQLPPQVQPTGPTGLTSNFYDPSYGIDRGFADQMTATNKRMAGTDAGQTQYDPATKSFYQTGGMTPNGPNPTLNGTYDQMYHKYDINNQLAGLGTPSSLTTMQQAEMQQQAGTNQFNAAQIDFMNKNQDVFGLPPQLTGYYPPVQPGKPQLPPQGGYGLPEQSNSGGAMRGLDRAAAMRGRDFSDMGRWDKRKEHHQQQQQQARVGLAGLGRIGASQVPPQGGKSQQLAPYFRAPN